jgi:hypothetical protein
MQAEFVERSERVLRIQKTDSMGRTKAQQEAMAANDPKPVKLGEGTLQVHAICADEHKEYPKVMYRLALRKGVPAGDEISPNYPWPHDLCLQLGITDLGFRVINKTSNSPGNVVVRHPWITRLVGTVKEDLTIDVEAAKAEEAKLRKDGWVDHPSKIKGLPATAEPEGYDPLPDEKSNGHARS